ncbi:MAG: hypothetical protein IJ520_08610 [Synergistaceae bacterium]|nr:hypothetical protein [Synergistaceae bacterium]
MKYNLNLALSYVWEIFTGVRDISDIVKHSEIQFKFKAYAALIIKLIRLLVIFALIFGGCMAVFFYYENFIKVHEQNLKIKAKTDRSQEQELQALAEKILKFRADGNILADKINLFESEPEAEAEADNNLPEMSVKAKILSSNKRKSLIILSVNKNNFRLRTGEAFTFEGMQGRVVSIKRDSVLINFNAREIEIK